MTFDDGILTVYNVNNTAAPGDKPINGLEEKAKYYYGYDSLGVTRYYTALQAKQQIESVVNIPGWNNIKVTDVCILEDKEQYTVRMVQLGTDENGLKIMKLSLERIGQTYEVPGES